MGPVHSGWCHPWASDMGCVRKTVEQTRRSEPVSSIPLCSQIHGLPLSSCLKFLTWLLLMMDSRSNKSFLSSKVLLICVLPEQQRSHGFMDALSESKWLLFKYSLICECSWGTDMRGKVNIASGHPLWMETEVAWIKNGGEYMSFGILCGFRKWQRVVSGNREAE